MRRSAEPLGREAWNSRPWWSDIWPGASTASTAWDSSTSTAFSWPRDKRLDASKVSRWGTISCLCEPGRKRMAPLSTVAGDSASQAVTSWAESRPQ